MTLTTLGVPPAGVYWNSVIYANMIVGVSPELSFLTKPNASVNLSVTPKLAMLPPQGLTLWFGPHIGMAGGSRQPATFSMEFAPKIVWIPCTAMQAAVTPSIGMTGSSKSTGSFTLAETLSIGMVGSSKSTGSVGVGVTPSLSMAGWLHPMGRQLNVSVMRASTN